MTHVVNEPLSSKYISKETSSILDINAPLFVGLWSADYMNGVRGGDVIPCFYHSYHIPRASSIPEKHKTRNIE